MLPSLHLRVKRHFDKDLDKLNYKLVKLASTQFSWTVSEATNARAVIIG